MLWLGGAISAGAAIAQVDSGSADPRNDSSDVHRSAPFAPGSFVPLTGTQMWHRYRKTFYDPWSILTAAASAGISQANDSVPEWGQGAEGFGRRLGNAYGKHVVKSSIRYGLDGLLGYDPRYWPSESSGFGRRTADAVLQMFRTRDNSGNWRVAYPTFIANFGTGFLSRAWNPPGNRDVSDALRIGAISFGIEAGTMVLKEFFRRAR